MTFPSTCAPDLRPVETLTVDAAEEQAWNERQLATPVVAPCARLWCYARPAVVLGRSQRALLGSLADRAAAPLGAQGGPLAVVQRSAGGGAVLVGPWMLGLSVVLPPAHRLLQGGSIAASYRWLADAFVAALADVGVTSAAVPPERTWKAPPDLSWACFAGVSAWEVAVGNRKLVGFAQRRGRHGALLVAGVLLGDVPWTRLCEAMHQPPAQAQALSLVTVDAARVAGHPVPAPVLADALAPKLARALAA